MSKASTKTCKMCSNPTGAGRLIYCSPKCTQQYQQEYNKSRWDSFSPERKRATGMVTTAILRGDLKRQPCEVCGRGSYVQAHHDDYADPLNVRWLCVSCHKRHHRAHGPGKNSYATQGEVA